MKSKTAIVRKNRLNWMISEIMVRKRIYENIFGNYKMNYLDITLIVYIFLSRILLFFFS